MAATPTTSLQVTRENPGELFIWTDVDAAHEEDFNRWYEREHMAERAGVPGFVWARRYRVSSGPRTYLALYRTESVNVFLTPEYRQVFEHQTAWSMANFARMTNTVRRVTAVAPLAGVGTGSAIALLPLGDRAMADRAAELIPGLLASHDGVLSTRVLVPDEGLSTPLPTPGADLTIEPYLVVDTTVEPVAAAAVRLAAEVLGPRVGTPTTYTLLWELRSNDLKAAA